MTDSRTLTAEPGLRPADRVTAVTAAGLVAVVVLAWWVTVADAGRMSCMLDGLARVGRAMPFNAGPFRFAVMWTVMMAAMMLPGIIPELAVRRDHERPFAGVAVAAGYLAVWVPTAAAAFGVLTILSDTSQPTSALSRIGGVVLTFAGGFQFSGVKRRLLHARARRTRYAQGAFRTGLEHGLWCVRCSWALMSVLLVVGVMNLIWMAGIGVICFAEKTFTRRARLATATAVGGALVGLGVATMIHPEALNVIAGRIAHVDGVPAMPMG